MKERVFVCVVAVDWSHYSEQVGADSEFVPVTCETYGLLLSEDTEKIVIVHQRFPVEDQVRHVSVIPRIAVISMTKFELVAKTVSANTVPWNGNGLRGVKVAGINA